MDPTTTVTEAFPTVYSPVYPLPASLSTFVHVAGFKKNVSNFANLFDSFVMVGGEMLLHYLSHSLPVAGADFGCAD